VTADLQILHFVGFLGAVQALVIAILVATIAAPRTRLFAALVGCLGLAMGIITLSHTPAGRSMPWLEPAEIAVSLAAPAILYLWVELTVRAETAVGRLRWLHFLPAAIWLVVAAALLGRGERAGQQTIPIEAIMAYQMLYTGAAAWRAFGPVTGAARRDEVRLARLTVGLLVAIHAAQLVRLFVHAPRVRNVVPATAAVVVFALTGLAIRQSRLFGPAAERREAKYEGSSLTAERAERGLEQLRRALEVERVFLRPELTLGELADEIGLARSHLSQIVNERCGVSFPELLAEHRVREAERLLADPATDHLTVESLGYRAGFNSRSAFYEAFKRATGLTPAAYRDRQGGPTG